MKKTKTSSSIPARRQPLADLILPALPKAIGGAGKGAASNVP
ncbi:MAG TPA: hypothetical protein VKY89_16065 [Thermoanaerobaculia bacterium]|jgi:hypothetical protein|nr:hypothetical protein [Thermoanaerobaculia bacterium]